MICYPNGVPNQVDGSEPEVKQIIQRVLQNLDMWGLRVSLLELQLLFKQATTQAVRTAREPEQYQSIKKKMSERPIIENVIRLCNNTYQFQPDMGGGGLVM